MAYLDIRNPPVFTEKVHRIEEEEYLTADLENEIKGALLNNEVFLKILVEAIQKVVKDHIESGTIHVTSQDKTSWSSKAAADHIHDERYYTETEVNNLFNEKLREIFRGRGRFTGNIDNLYNKSDNGIYWCAVPEGCNGDFPSEMTGILYFFLTVESDNDNSAKQTIVTWDNFTTLVRMRVNNVWSAWKRLVLAENICNPNILINADFRNPINQRNEDSYISTLYKYTIDRWELYGGTLEFNDDSISLIKIENQNFPLVFRQQIEMNLIGKTVTLSLSVDEKIYSTTCYINSSNLQSKVVFIPSTVGSGMADFKADILTTNGRTSARIYHDSVTSEDEWLKVKWIKLEYGSVATQFVPSNPAEELLKCQRYYKKIDYGVLGYSSYSNTMIIDTDVAKNMRVMPTVIFTKNTTKEFEDLIVSPLSSQGVNSAIWIPTSVSINKEGCIRLRDIDINFAHQTVLLAGFNSCNFLELDAEIY